MTARQAKKDQHTLKEKIEKERIEKKEIQIVEAREIEEKEKEEKIKMMRRKQRNKVFNRRPPTLSCMRLQK